MRILGTIERFSEQWLRRFGVALLEISLGVTYIWFGALKVMHAGPTMPILHVAFPNFPYPLAASLLGGWEILIGGALLLPLLPLSRFLNQLSVRTALLLIFSQIVATIAAAFFAPSAFFSPAPPFLTVVGEFLIKNLVLLFAALVVAGHLRSPAENQNGNVSVPKA